MEYSDFLYSPEDPPAGSGSGDEDLTATQLKM